MKRYESLDVLRGMTVALMIVVNNGGGPVRFGSLRHCSWEGCTMCDLVFPTFIFCAGVSMAFSLSRFDGLDGSALRKILKRGLLVFLTGLVLTAFPFFPLERDPGLSFWQNWLDWAGNLRIMGVLQRIALCYVAGSVLVLTLRRTKWILGVIGGLSLVYTAVLLLFGTAPGPFSYEGNAANRVDTWCLGLDHMYKTFTAADGTVTGFEPEGLLSTLSAVCTILAGYLAGNLVRTSSLRYAEGHDGKWSATSVAAKLFCWSAACTAGGLLLSTWIPMVKKIWTTSYMLYAAGASMFMFALLIYLTDVKGYGRMFYPFKAMGMNALALYCLAWVVAVTLSRIVGWDKSVLFGANEYTSLLYSLLFMGVHLIVAVILYRKKIFIKL